MSDQKATEAMVGDRLPKVRHWPTKAIHAVYATDAFREGSLAGFTTLCGLLIEGDTMSSENAWMEEPSDNDCSCLRCRNTLAWRDAENP